jgi:hypothetical protein
MQSTSDAGEEARDAEDQRARLMRVEAEEAHAVLVIAQGECQTAERRAGESPKAPGRKREPEESQIIDLNIGPKGEPPGRPAFGLNTGFGAEHRVPDRRQRVQQLGERKRHHREVDAGALGREPTKNQAE